MSRAGRPVAVLPMAAAPRPGHLCCQHLADRARRTCAASMIRCQGRERRRREDQVKRNRCIQLSGGTTNVNRTREAEACALASLKGYRTITAVGPLPCPRPRPWMPPVGQRLITVAAFAALRCRNRPYMIKRRRCAAPGPASASASGLGRPRPPHAGPSRDATADYDSSFSTKARRGGRSLSSSRSQFAAKRHAGPPLLSAGLDDFGQVDKRARLRGWPLHCDVLPLTVNGASRFLTEMACGHR